MNIITIFGKKVTINNPKTKELSKTRFDANQSLYAKNLDIELQTDISTIPLEFKSILRNLGVDICTPADFSPFDFYGNKMGDRIDYNIYYKINGLIDDNLFLYINNIDQYPMTKNSKTELFFSFSIYKYDSLNLIISIYFRSKLYLDLE
jgi:hypothetical protein